MFGISKNKILKFIGHRPGSVFNCDNYNYWLLFIDYINYLLELSHLCEHKFKCKFPKLLQSIFYKWCQYFESTSDLLLCFPIFNGNGLALLSCLHEIDCKT